MSKFKYQCVKRQIEEKAFKAFLKIKKQGYLKKKPFDENIKFKDCHFWIEYLCNGVEFRNGLDGYGYEWSYYPRPQFEIECRMVIEYPALLCVTKKGIKRKTDSTIELVITSQCSHGKPNKPQKNLFYLRLKESKNLVNLIKLAACKNAKAYFDENWESFVKSIED